MCDGSENVANQIGAALLFLRNVNDDVYEQRAWEKHYAIYGESELLFDNTTCGVTVVYPNDQSGHTKEQQHTHFFEVMEQAEEETQTALEKGFTIIAKNLRWWLD